jgi:hypothetical protein
VALCDDCGAGPRRPSTTTEQQGAGVRQSVVTRGHRPPSAAGGGASIRFEGRRRGRRWRRWLLDAAGMPSWPWTDGQLEATSWRGRMLGRVFPSHVCT